ncbi:MAG: lytic transglycosylase domain-containing protein [Nitrospirae bacterium]|nr:lytic transglycosylase domain-containing protein [Nitrospirota bacterium]
MAAIVALDSTQGPDDSSSRGVKAERPFRSPPLERSAEGRPWLVLRSEAPLRRVASGAEGTECQDPFTPAAVEFGLSPKLLYAIAKVESGARRNALNVRGKGYQGLLPSEAAGKAQVAWRRGESFDLCVMQINSQHLGKELARGEAVHLLDAGDCVRRGARILAENYLRTKDILRAIALYHSPNRARGDAYALKVMRAWRAIGSERLCVEAVEPWDGVGKVEAQSNRVSEPRKNNRQARLVGRASFR